MILCYLLYTASAVPHEGVLSYGERGYAAGSSTHYSMPFDSSTFAFCMPIPGSSSDAKGNYVALG